MIIVLLVITGFVLYLTFRYKTESLSRGSRALSHGLDSLGNEEENSVRCPKCSKRIKRSDSPYCSDCHVYF